MRRALALAGIATLLGCARTPAPEPPDPCPGLRARFESLRTARPCASEADCVPTLAISDAPPSEEGQMGRPSATHETCTPATHRDSLADVEAAARAFASAGCGSLVPVSSVCGSWGHGQHILCVEHACEAAY